MARTAYWIVDLSSYAEPTAAQVAAGNRTGGATALVAGSEAFTATSGTGTISESTLVSTLTAGVSYRVSWVIYDDVALDYSGLAHTVFVAPSVFSESVSESAACADDLAELLVAQRAVVEAASASDAYAATSVLAAAMAESAAAAETTTAVLVAVAAVSESATASDTVATGAAAYEVAVIEAASAADTVAAIATRVAAASEALATADAVTVTAVYGVSVAEAAAATDATNWGGAVYAGTVAEAATLSDAVAAALSALASMAEAASAGETVATVLSAGVSVLEAAAAADAVAAAMQIAALLSETAAAADTVATSSGSTVSDGVAETIAVADLLVATVSGFVVILTRAPQRPQTAGAVRPAADAGAARPRNRPGPGR